MPRLMFVGDSLTAVDQSSPGFKGYLLALLKTAGYSIDSVGSQTSTGPSGWVSDPQHEGHSGWQTSHFLQGSPTYIRRMVQTYQPDVINLMVGTNDVWSNVPVATALTRLRQILNEIYAVRSDEFVVLNTIASMNTGQSSQRAAYNDGVKAIAAEFKAAGRKIRLADVGSLNVQLQGDGVHWTTPTGHQSVANFLKPIYDEVLTGSTGGGSTSDAWLSGQSGMGVSDDTFSAWVGGRYTTEIAGTWADTGPAEQVEVYTVSGGEFRYWHRPIDVAVGAIWKEQGETWAQAATGVYDARWTLALQKLAAARAGKGTTYIRFAHEFSLSYFPWSVLVGEETDFKAAWVRFKNLRDTHFPTAKLVWCPNDGSDTALDIRNCWPGNANVDVYGVDSYNAYPALNDSAAIATRFATTQNGGAPKGLEAHRLLAESYGKPLAITEWASSGDPAHESQGADTPGYFTYLFDWLRANAGTAAGKVLYEIGFFGHADFARYRLHPTTMQPNAAAKYRELWALKDTPVVAPPPVPEPQPTGRILFETDFTGTDGAAPPAMLIPGQTFGGATGTIQSNDLRIVTGTGSYGGGKWSRRLNLTTPTADAEVRVTFVYSTTGGQELNLVVRGENNVDTQSGYTLAILPALGSWRVSSQAEWNQTTIGSAQSLSGFTNGDEVTAVLRVVGSSVRGKLFKGAEPSTWAVDGTSTSYPAAGAVGISVRSADAGTTVTIKSMRVSNGAEIDDTPIVAGTFEASSESWTSLPSFGAYDVAPAPVRTTDPAHVITGTGSLLATWPAPGAAGKSWVNAPGLTGLTPGQRYALTLDVKVPAGSPDVYATEVFRARSAPTSVKDAVVTLSTQFTPGDAGTAWVGVGTTNPVAGGKVAIDNVRVVPVAGGNLAPTIVKGAEVVRVEPGEEFTLSGWSAADPEHQPVTWSWDAGLATLVRGGTTPSPTFKAPAASEPLEFYIRPTVVDQVGGQATAWLLVLVGAHSLLFSRQADGSRRWYRAYAPKSEATA